MLLQAATDASSRRSFDLSSRDWGAAFHPVRPFRKSEPNAATCTRPVHPVAQLSASAHDRRAIATSATWTSSSGDLAELTDADDVGLHDELVEEYNRLARKHGIRTLAPGNHAPSLPDQSPRQRRSWFSRTFLRQVSVTSDASSTKSEKKIRRKRSVGDLALHLMNGARRDNLKDAGLQSLVRLCGKSLLYLPSEYSPGSLVLPTCFRATAQYLVQHGAETRGVFRIPGSIRVVNALYNHYCADGDADEIASTICCPNLPSHIKVGTRDVASTFKRLLSGLPGGILGSLPLFDALVAIHSQLDGEAELTRTKQTKVRARLIALAIGAVRSQLRRDLICAVFGLLCLIGRAAEKAPREDEHGRPLPTSALMGYNALGIVFGPLLIGDLLTSYTMKSAGPSCGLASSPATPTSARKERRKSKVPEDTQPPGRVVDKIHVANSIAEMLIINWREVVRHMKSLGLRRAGRDGYHLRAGMGPSASEAFAMGRPHSASGSFAGVSPAPSSPTPDPARGTRHNPPSSLVIPRRRPRPTRPLSSHARTMTSVLSPPVEEPSPAMLERSRGDASTPGTPRRHGICRRTRERGANSFESARPPGSPAALATPIKGQKVEQQMGSPSRGTETPLKRKFYNDIPSAAAFARGRSRLSDWRSGRGPLASAETGSPVARPTGAARLQSPRHGFNQPETGSEVIPIDRSRHRTSHDGTRNGEPATETGYSPDRASTDSVPSSAISRHAATFHLNKGNRPALLRSNRTILFGPRTQPARPTVDTAPQSTPVSMAGSAVKAMAAMFESASTGPISPPTPGENSRNRAEFGPSGILSPYAVSSLSVKSPSRSPKPTDPNGGERHPRWSATRDPPPPASEGTAESAEGTANTDCTCGKGRLSETARDGSCCDTTSPPTVEPTAYSESPVRRSNPNQPHTPASQHTTPNLRGSSSSKRLPRQKALGIGRSPADRPDTIISTSRIEPKLATTTPRLSPSVPWTKSPPASTAGCQGPITRRFPLVSTQEQQQGDKSETVPYNDQTIHAHATPFMPTPKRNAAPLPLSETHPSKLQQREIDADRPGESCHYTSADKTQGRSDDALETVSANAEANLVHELELELKLELVRLRERLRQTEQACALWRERAERAERRVEELEAYAFVL